jgi:hypothetical protein
VQPARWLDARTRLPSQVLRDELNFCVVDEGDSVLIDEARVPLIISGRTAASVEKYQTGAKLAQALEPVTHYEVFEKEQTIGARPLRARRTPTPVLVGMLQEAAAATAAAVRAGVGTRRRVAGHGRGQRSRSPHAPTDGRGFSAACLCPQG